MARDHDLTLPKSQTVPKRPHLAWLVPVVLAAYVQRFAVSWWTVEHVAAPRFDPHGFGLLGDGVLLLALAPPLSVLLWWILRRRRLWRGLFAPASSPVRTAVSGLLLVLIGAPTPGQVWAFFLLPLAAAWPAIVSALVWLSVCAVLRGVAVGEQDGRPMRVGAAPA